MKITLTAVLISTILVGCATDHDLTPGEARIARIQRICAVDAAIRPVVTQLLESPDVSDEDRSMVAVARAAIDPICANPSGSVEANVITTLTANTGNILAVMTKLQSK